MSSMGENYSSLLGGRFAAERQRLGLLQSQLAEACGVSREMIGRYERGKAVPGGEVLFSFAELGADVQYVLTGRRCGESEPAHPVDEATLAIEALLILEEELARAGVVMDRKARAMLALGGWSQVRQEADTEGDQLDLLRKLFRMTVSLHAVGQPRTGATQQVPSFQGSQQNFNGKVGQTAGRDIVNKGKKK